MAKTVVSYKSEGKDNPVFEVLDTAGALTVKLDNTQILAERQTAVSDATDAATAITQINAIIDALEAHGLLAPNGE